MKVAFFNPPSPNKRKIMRMIDCSHEAKANYLWQPNDFMIMTSHLKASDEAILIDGTADALSETVFFEKISKINTFDLMIFAFSSVCWESDYNYFKQLKEKNKNIPIFVIGDIFLEEYYKSLILAESDGIIYQPYEIELDKMVDIRANKTESINGICLNTGQDFFTGTKKVIYSPIESFPKHELFIKNGYGFPFAKHFKFTTVTSNWGCPFSCSYCTDSKIPPMVRQAKDIFKELDYVKKLGIKELFFADKTFGFPKENAINLLKEMIEKFSFSWSCYHHPELYDPELLDLMAKAGCHTIIVGIDSVNYKSLSNYNRNVSQDKAEALIKHANSLNMSICADFILGLEHENEEDLIKTINYSLTLPIDFASFNIATPLPGSSIREQALKDGRITLGVEGFDTLGDKKVLGSKQVSSEKLLKLKTKAIKSFYLRPSYILRRIKKTKSLEHLSIQFLEMLSMFRKSF